MTTVPRLWPDSTIVCVASGPSLTPADVEACRGKAKVLVIKDAVRLAPWADALWACDAKWWRHYGDTLTFSGLKFTLDKSAAKWATVIENTGFDGLETNPIGVRNGRNSGYQAIGLAFHLGAKRVRLLGYDMQPDAQGKDHFFGPHPWRTRPPYALMMPLFSTLVTPLLEHGVDVINCSRVSALDCWPKVPLQEALS